MCATVCVRQSGRPELPESPLIVVSKRSLEFNQEGDLVLSSGLTSDTLRGLFLCVAVKARLK